MLALTAGAALADETPIPVTLPAMRIGTAPLIALGAANTFFSTKRVVNATPLAQLEGRQTALPAPPEIVELARALKNDPDLIYEYVRNNIDVDWMHGLHKGALGTLIDKSGTPFDQAALLVALLNQAGYQADYQIGWIQLTSAQFAAWTGVSDKNAACQMLANGGMSAVFDTGGSSAFCGTGAGGSFGNVKLNHVWVKAAIPGSSCSSACLFDPSYKTYAKWTGIDVAAAAQIGSGASSPLSIATAGLTTGTLTGGVPSSLGFYTNGTVQNPGLFDKLSAYSQNILNYLYANGLETAHMEDVAGGGVIVPYASPPGGLRQTALPYMGQQTTSLVVKSCSPSPASLCVVPDAYRATLRVRGYMYDYACGVPCPNPNAQWKPMFDAPFFADEIYGRAVTVDTDYSTANYYKSYRAGPNRYANLVTLHVDGVQVGGSYLEPGAYEGSNELGFPIVASTRGAPAYVTLDVDHPYPATGIDGDTANNGGYMREQVTKSVRLITGLSIVAGFGNAGAPLFGKLSEERGSDSPMPYEFSSCPAEGDGGKCVSYYPGGTGDFERLKMAASWMAQYSRAARLHAAIGHMTYQLHHAIGVAYGDAILSVAYQQMPPYGSNPDTPQADSFNRLDIDSGVSFQSRTADAAKRRAVIAAFAASASALEGSVAAQLDDLPDTASTATRFEWANTPQGFGYWDAGNAYEDPAGVRRAFVQFTGANIGSGGANAAAVALIENHAASWYGVSGHCGTLACGLSNPGQAPTIGSVEALGWQEAYRSEISAYVDQGYGVVTSQEAFLGPGQRASGDVQWAIGHVEGHTTYGYYGHAATKQRGPAFVATLYDAATGLEPVAIAHDVVALGSYGESSVATKGGGGGAQPNQSTSYSPSEAGDLLRSRFVDKSSVLGVNLSNGSFGTTAPGRLVVGNGGFPYALSAEFQWNPQALPPPGQAPPSPVMPNPGWTTSWQNRLALSGSGQEAMGASDVRAAVGTLAAIAVAQDVYASTPSMAREVVGVLAGAWWVRQMNANTVTVALGTQSRQFLGLPQGVSLPTGESWFLPGPSYATLHMTGARKAYEQICQQSQLPGTQYAASRGWDDSQISAVDVTNAGGDVQHFVPWSSTYVTLGYYKCGFAQGFRLAKWSFPKGGTDADKLEITLAYGQKYDPEGLVSTGFDRLLSVSNSIGREIDFTSSGLSITGFNNHLGGADARSVALGDFTGFGADGIAGSVTDPANAKTRYAFLPGQARSDTQRPIPHALLTQVYTPDTPTKPNLQYNYDAMGRVKEILDAQALQQGNRTPWRFYIADGTRGERDDPLGNAWSVIYDTWGHPSRYTDERGYETDTAADGRGRVLTTAYPEGDCETFAYDDHGNTTDLWKVDKASSCNTSAGASHVLHVSAQWDQVWNKPTQVTDARGNTTTLEYFAAGLDGAGEIKTATRPVDNAGVHPVYSFAYDDYGKVADSYVPFQGAQKIRTHYTYEADEDLDTVVVDYGGLALTTTYDYDANGDVKTTKDPRNFLTESKYDKDRRPTEQIHHDGATTGAAINAYIKTQYDLVGRETEQDAAKCFNTASPCLASGSTVATWVATKTTTYTPTGKVATVTDADGGVTSTIYDAVDRASIVTDPVLRQTFFTYDPASNVLTETRGRGTQNQAVYASYTYTPNGLKSTVIDADGPTHVTMYDYDGFDRLIKTTYPDNTTDKVTLADENGNIRTRINRAGQTFTYTYDNLNRMLTKVMPAVTGVNPQVTTSWAYYLNGAIADLSDTSGNDLNTRNSGSNVFFDTAGRLVRTDTTIPGITGALTSSYELDANGNRTKLTWPDTYYVTYGYDSLNRMTSAKESGTLALASYSYDALARLTSKTQRAGMVSAYGYTGNDADLTSLGLTTSGTGTLPSYTMTYSPAHQLAGEIITGTGYAWQPAAAATDTYTAVNALNQYVKWSPDGSAAKNFNYDDNGNTTRAVINGTAWIMAYDPENKLVTASGGTVAAAYDYDVLGRRNHKSGTGVTETYFLDDGTDEIAEYTSAAGTPTMTMRYIPGRAINETIGSVTPSSGVRRLYLTDRHGSVIAIGNNGGDVIAGPYTYDEYGKGAAPDAYPYKYVGMRLDAETGFYFDRARFYSAEIGRFFQPDPVGYTAGMNLYPYADNDPVNGVDPTGLYEFKSCGSDTGCADAQVQFEAQRQTNLKSSDSDIVATAKAYGDPGEQNGISVGFKTQSQLDAQYGAGPGAHVGGHEDTGATGGTPNLTVWFPQGLSDRDMQQAVGHEGSHVQDDVAFIKTFDPTTGKYSANANFTLRQTERKAYTIGLKIKPYNSSSFNQHNNDGPQGMHDIDHYITQHYKKPDQFVWKQGDTQ